MSGQLECTDAGHETGSTDHGGKGMNTRIVRGYSTQWDFETFKTQARNKKTSTKLLESFLPGFKPFFTSKIILRRQTWSKSNAPFLRHGHFSHPWQPYMHLSVAGHFPDTPTYIIPYNVHVCTAERAQLWFVPLEFGCADVHCSGGLHVASVATCWGIRHAILTYSCASLLEERNLSKSYKNHEMEYLWSLT